jgi:hypothetical protein
MSACLEIPDLFLVLNMISHSFAALTREISFNTRNKSGISAHPWPCIVLYKLQIIQLNFSITKSSLKYEIIFHNFVCWRFSTPAPAKYSGAPALVPVLRLQRTALLSASKAWSLQMSELAHKNTEVNNSFACHSFDHISRRRKIADRIASHVNQINNVRLR